MTERGRVVRAIRFAILCVILAGCPRKPPLFLEPLDPDVDSLGRRDAIPVRVDLDRLRGDRVEMRLARDLPVIAKRVAIIPRGPDDFTWLGKIDGNGSAVLVVHGSQVTGILRVGHEIYDVVALPGGGHRLDRLTNLPRPPSHSARFRQLKGRALPPRPPTNGPPPTIEILVAYTQAMRDLRPDIDAVAQAAVDEANQINKDSGAGLVFHLVKPLVFKETEREDPDFTTNVIRFQTPKDTHYDEVQDVREARKADVAVLVLANNTAYLGDAAAIMAVPETAYAAVDYRYLAADFVLAHEVGHLLGLHHEAEDDPDPILPFSDGHGYRAAAGDGAIWESIMATACGVGCSRAPRWSNPAIAFGEYAGRMAGGKAHVNDEARVLSETAWTVAGFR